MANTKSKKHSEWSSRFAFILAATGSAVGLGNIWKFPYITGENGGGAFVIVYLLCVVVIGIPIMMAETMIGRRGRQSPVNAMKKLAKEASADSRWQYLGWLGVSAGMIILSYYSVIAGWALAYVLKAITGTFMDGSVQQIGGLFDSFVQDPGRQVFWHSTFMILTMLVVVRGVQDGLEKAVRFLMPSLFVLLILLVGYAMNTDAYDQGLSFMFNPDFSKITGNSVLTAMGHAFFTLSLGMGAIMVYGSYLPKDVSIAKTVFMVAGADTVVALLAGIAIFPLVFANGLEPSTGPGLIFQTLPIAFGQMTGGVIFGTLFFVLLVFAALSSSISLIEPAVAWMVENKGYSRLKACVLLGSVVWFIGLGTVLSFNEWADVTVLGKNIFELLDFLTANLMLPIGGLLIAVFAGWVMRRQHSQDELQLNNKGLFYCWVVLVRYVSPAAVFLVFIHVIGIL
ncbi:MAG TPA: sodium-dependent transporter [Methylococcaceae bacterium]|jgi:NSS family neurotransmitter:Na+ symporter|nr:sodium-dependent transporter [Methylococcaceae bacterium]HIN67936.1 sodium-dependent transporter [Methylococcales bacterium]HIA45389.1 sodium-dependent transporter [Methylococcaceae bacterium]HIB61761.1 sodium-dependent transporter [Methylococcaceae bacterium]HIO12464.1 sodium-dependent transporter [Methylococcales bacterium]